MSYYSNRSFDTRVGRIERKHRKLARGGVTVMRSDGLMVLRPRRTGLFRVVMFSALAAAFIIGFKAVVFISEGEISYQSRIDRLAAGTGPEFVASRIMEIDPATQVVLDHGGPYIQQAIQAWNEFRPTLVAEYWGRT